MISWGSIAYGAALSAAAAVAAGPLAWNAVLRDAGGDGFFVDAQFAALPASWQGTGSGVFATAAAALVLGLAQLRGASSRRVALVAPAYGIAAFSSTSASTKQGGRCK